MSNQDSKIRIEVGIQMCISHPGLVRLVMDPRAVPRDQKEKERFQVLEGILNLEPSLRHIIKFYARREKAQ